jgi:hypothetical protein
VRIEPLTTTDGFVLYDLDDAERSVGVARLAPKVLHESSELLARSITYLFASFDLQIGGASAGINAKPDIRDDALTAFVGEVGGNRAVTLYPSTGLSDDDLAPLGAPALDVELGARGAIAAAEAIAGDGLRAAVVGAGPTATAVTAALGGSVEGELTADVDAVFVGGKAGVIDDTAAATIKAKVVVPISTVPVTAKAYAVLGRAGVIYVPDFLALAAPYLVTFAGDSPDGALARVRAAVDDVKGNGVDAWLAAAKRAEGFLSTWQPQLPFGRPLA